MSCTVSRSPAPWSDWPTEPGAVCCPRVEKDKQQLGTSEAWDVDQGLITKLKEQYRKERKGKKGVKSKWTRPPLPLSLCLSVPPPSLSYFSLFISLSICLCLFSFSLALSWPELWGMRYFICFRASSYDFFAAASFPWVRTFYSLCLGKESVFLCVCVRACLALCFHFFVSFFTPFVLQLFVFQKR